MGKGIFCVHPYMCLCVLIKYIEVRGQPQLCFLGDYPPPPLPLFSFKTGSCTTLVIR